MEYRQQLLFPFARVKPGSAIVLYGAGDVGQTFYHQVAASGYCRVAGWTDRRWSGQRDLPLPLMPLEALPSTAFDHVVIALGDPAACAAVAASLESMGVDPLKLVRASDSLLQFSLCHPSDAGQARQPSADAAFARVLCGAAGIEWSSAPGPGTGTSSTTSGRIWNMAIVGTGFMAKIMANAVKRRLDNVRLYAVVSRDAARAQAFAERFGIERAYDSCAALAADPQVDLVHVATPVALHHEQSLLFLRHGKHVLCEKPFALNERQAREMFAAAKENGRVLADGVWPRYLPLALKLQQILTAGVIGKICTLTGNLFYPASTSPRLNDIALGGGISLENATYLMALASLVLGRDVRMVTAAGLVQGGIDRQSSITLLYDEAMAVFTCGMDGISDRRACIYGEKGFIVVDNANEYKKITVFDAAGKPVESHSMQSGYEHEVRACLKAMAMSVAEREQGSALPYGEDETCFALRMLDAVRLQLGVRYAADSKCPGAAAD